MSSLNLKTKPSTMKLMDPNGSIITLEVDPAVTQVSGKGANRLEDIKVGQAVEVQTISRGQTQVAKRVTVVGDAASAEPGQPAQSDRRPGA